MLPTPAGCPTTRGREPSSLDIASSPRFYLPRAKRRAHRAADPQGIPRFSPGEGVPPPVHRADAPGAFSSASASCPSTHPSSSSPRSFSGKGGGETDKEVYRFTDHGGRDVAMRFDLTVPFARFMAAHLAEVGLPFRRWHAAKVWRGRKHAAGSLPRVHAGRLRRRGHGLRFRRPRDPSPHEGEPGGARHAEVDHPLRAPGRLQRVPRAPGPGEAVGRGAAHHRQAAEDRQREDPRDARGDRRGRRPPARSSISSASSRLPRRR